MWRAVMRDAGLHASYFLMMCNQAGEWLPPPAEVVLQRGALHVWRVNLNQPARVLARLEPVLDATETQRAARFHFQRDRRKFIVAHAALRDILARYLHHPPTAFRFETTAYGKPVLTGADSWLQFNLSHSGERALVAVAREAPVGVDVEQMREDFGGESIARRFFSSPEVEALFALPPDHRSRAFFLCWTRKEAFIKAIGLGVSFPLDGFAVSLHPDEPARLLWVRNDPQAVSQWTLAGLEPGPGYAGALAIAGSPRRVCLWEWQTPR